MGFTARADEITEIVEPETEETTREKRKKAEGTASESRQARKRFLAGKRTAVNCSCVTKLERVTNSKATKV